MSRLGSPMPRRMLFLFFFSFRFWFKKKSANFFSICLLSLSVMSCVCQTFSLFWAQKFPQHHFLNLLPKKTHLNIYISRIYSLGIGNYHELVCIAGDLWYVWLKLRLFSLYQWTCRNVHRKGFKKAVVRLPHQVLAKTGQSERMYATSSRLKNRINIAIRGFVMGQLRKFGKLLQLLCPQLCAPCRCNKMLR